LDIVNTFVHAKTSKLGSQQVRSRRASLTGFAFIGSRAYLNRNVCLLLHHLGVPFELFEELLIDEVDNILQSNNDLKSAFKLVSRHAKIAALAKASGRLHSENRYHAVDDSGTDTDDEEPNIDVPGHVKSDMDDLSMLMKDLNASCSSHCDASMRMRATRPVLSFPRTDCSPSELALKFLFSGHSLEEPLLRQIISKMQLESLRKLQKCHIPCDDTAYLVGVPDPYGILQPGEVFIMLPSGEDFPSKPTNSFRNTHHVSNNSGSELNSGLGDSDDVPKDPRCVVGAVLVSRNPMMHAGDIRKYNAVNYHRLQALCQDTFGGLVIFPVRGDRAAGDEMSGGDYDGDLYLVLFGQCRIIPYVRTVPSPASSIDDQDLVINEPNMSVHEFGASIRSNFPVSDSENTDDEIGWSIFQGNQIVVLIIYQILSCRCNQRF
jgi:hypothetical protein